jgi:aspartyl-tRNA(Asn)/glutamyl-tRNA(Gln) amidotransferase subunit B
MIRALSFEIERQSKLLSQGEEVLQETVGWDEKLSTTFSQRSKEEAHDYRYFPEPDLPPLHIESSWIEEIKSGLPELPNARRNRFVNDYELTPYTAGVLTADRTTADFYEEVLSAGKHASPQHIANWLSGDLFSLLNENNLSIDEIEIAPASVADLISRIENGEISANSGNVVLGEMFKSNKSPSAIIDDLGLGQISDPVEINSIVTQVLEENPQQREQYLKGKKTLIEWFFGQVMRRTRSRADPTLVREALESQLNG